jgi:anthranilate phosphoribosyltransferase
MIDDAIAAARAGRSLTRQQTARALGAVMDGRASPVKIAALLTALAVKGESADEVAGGALAMRRRMLRVRAAHRPLLDTCGTGGDGTGTINVSTLAALVAAAAGVPVAKHGNRAASSRCGSADLLEALGVRIDLTPRQMERSLRRVGFAFLMAPTCHPAMKYAGPVRRELGFRTIFNLLGPLTNPAGADVQTIGVFSWEKARLMARVLSILGTRRALVFHGAGGHDELTPCGPNRVCDVRGRALRTYVVGPRDFGLPRCRASALTGGSPPQNAALALGVLRGERGPLQDVVVMNAGAALAAAGRTRTFQDGAALARQALRSGAALRILEQLRAL